MPRIAFDDLPGHARLWVFPSGRALSPSEEGRFLERVDRFLDAWAAHGSPLTSGRDWREGRFLLVAVDETTAPPSGCSIDALANVLKEVGREMGVDLLDHAPVWYRDGDEIRRVSRGEFKGMAGEGRVDTRTAVFDNTVTRLSQLRAGEWEKPAGASWHRRAFFPSS